MRKGGIGSNFCFFVLVLLVAVLASSASSAQSQQATPNPFAQLRFRFVGITGNRAAAVVGEPGDSQVIYVGAASGGIWKSTDGGQTWRTISPDLTTNDKSHQQPSGGVGSEQVGQFDGAALYVIAESPLKPGDIWTGSNDGQVNVTLDGGAHWTNVTQHIPDLPPWGAVENIELSRFDAATAYISVNLQQMGDYNSYVFKTTDNGRTWRSIGSDLPKSVDSPAHCVIEDPVRRGML